MPKKIAPDAAPPDPMDDGPVVRHDHDHTHHHVHHDHGADAEYTPKHNRDVPAGGNPFHQTYGREDTTPVRKRK